MKEHWKTGVAFPSIEHSKHGYLARMGIVKQISGHPDIPGLRYFPDFISEDTAARLLERINQETWSTELKRRVQHYGYRYDYKARSISEKDRLGTLPTWLDQFTDQHLLCSVLSEQPDQVIANEYLPGQGISPHIDCIPCFGDTIASLSLANAAMMVFTDLSGRTEKLYLQPRSLLIMTDEARLKWRHAIPARKSDMVNNQRLPRGRRVSLTFRKVLLG